MADDYSIDDLASKYGGNDDLSKPLLRITVTKSPPSKTIDVDSLAKRYSSDNVPSIQTSPDDTPEWWQGATNPAIKAGISAVRGFKDVIDTGAHGILNATSAIANKLLPENLSLPIQDYKNQIEAEDIAGRNKFNQEYPPSTSIIPNLTDIGRIGGQVLATAPLLPVRAIQGIGAITGALPTIGATGAKVAAPLINRLAAATGTGALGGAEYGAATASANDDSTASNIGTGLITGALAGPVASAAGTIGSKVLPTISSMWANINIGKLAASSGIPASAIKNIVSRLDEIGLTPQTAQAALNKLGPDATLMDLDKALTAEGSGLASLGGGPTSILKNRMDNRALTKNTQANDIIERRLGPKPDIEVEKQNIINQARKDTKVDYQLAHNSAQQLNSKSIVDDIDNKLEKAVGSEASKLRETKSYLYRQDAEGNPVLKTDVESLHKVRQGLDDLLSKSKTEGTSQTSATYRAISNVRDAVDKELKTNPQMKSADEKFAAKMNIAKGLDIGNQIFSDKISREQFDKLFSKAPAEVQDTVRKGMRVAIGDYMEKASRGELEGAQQLFGQKSLNRAKFKIAFGADADAVLNALQKEASFRATEKAVSLGSQTAERLAIQKRYADQASSGIVRDLVKGVIADATTGSAGVGTAITIGHKIAGHTGIKIGANKLSQLTTGSADILSRQGKSRDIAMDILNKTNKIQNNIATPSTIVRIAKKILPTKLPVTPLLAAPIGEGSYKRAKKFIGQ